MSKTILYKAVEVWERLSQRRLVRYRCWQVSPSRRYCVQSADFYYLPITDEQLLYHERNFIELLCEDAPENRSATFKTLEEAIANHEAEFNDIEVGKDDKPKKWGRGKKA